MGSLGMIIGGFIAAGFLLILYWTVTAKPPADEGGPRQQAADEEPHVLVARFQLESAADITPGVMLRRERYLVDPVQVPRRSKEMTWTMLLVALGGDKLAQKLGIRDLRDPENPDLGISLIESYAVPDLVKALQGSLAKAAELAQALVKLDPGEPDPGAVERALAGEALSHSASAAEEAAALALEVLRQAKLGQDSPLSLYVSYRGEVTPPTVSREQAVLFLGRTGSIAVSEDYARISAEGGKVEFAEKRYLPLRSRSDVLADLLTAGGDDLAAVEVTPAADPDPLLGITIVIEPGDLTAVAIPVLRSYLNDRAAELATALAGDGDRDAVEAALKAGVAPEEGEPSAALDAAALVRPLLEVAKAAAEAGEAVYMAYLPRRWSPSVAWAPALSDAQRASIREATRAWFGEQELEHELAGGEVTAAGETEPAFKVSLAHLARACDGKPDGEWGEVIRATLSLLHQAHARVGELPGLPFEEVSPKLMVRLYAGQEPLEEVVTREDLPGTKTALVYDLVGAVFPVPSKAAESWGKEPDELFQLGLENVAKTYPLPAEEGPERAGATFVVEGNDEGVAVLVFNSQSHPYTPTHALLLAEHPDLLGPRQTVVGLSDGYLTLFGVDDDTSPEVLNRVIYEFLASEDGPLWGAYVHDRESGALTVASPEALAASLED